MVRRERKPVSMKVTIGVAIHPSIVSGIIHPVSASIINNGLIVLPITDMNTNNTERVYPVNVVFVGHIQSFQAVTISTLWFNT